MTEQLHGLQVISIIGRQGSGKTTIGQGLAKKLSTKCVEVSTVVRAANESLDDLHLAQSGLRTKSEPNWLSDLIYECLIHTAHEMKSDFVVLTGAREPNIHSTLQDEKKLAIWSIALWAHPNTRFERLILQGRITNAQQFLDREVAELRLGLADLVEKAPFIAKTSDKTKPEYIVEGAYTKLKEKGIVC